MTLQERLKFILKKIGARIKGEAVIVANIKSFRLAEWVKEGSETLDLVRQYAKTGKQSLLDQLLATGAVLGHSEGHNLITTRGRAVLAERLAGGTTYTGEINYGALGTGVSPVPANASTQLVNEVYRKLASSQTFDNNIAYVDFFYEATEVSGTFTEFANFIDGLSGANTGRIWSFIATGGWTKSLTESLFVSCQYTIN